MIKIKTKYDYKNDVFTLIKAKYNDTCRFEVLSLAHYLLTTLLENDKELDKKTMYKILKDMDKEEIEEI